jgi:hypothetical protein
MEKWVIRVIIIIVIFWVSLYGYSYYLGWKGSSTQSGGTGNSTDFIDDEI